MKNKKTKLIYGKICVYSISLALIIISFILPPKGQIDPTVIFSTGMMLGFFEIYFGNSIKHLQISKDGVDIEVDDEDKN